MYDYLLRSVILFVVLFIIVPSSSILTAQTSIETGDGLRLNLTTGGTISSIEFDDRQPQPTWYSALMTPSESGGFYFRDLSLDESGNFVDSTAGSNLIRNGDFLSVISSSNWYVDASNATGDRSNTHDTDYEFKVDVDTTDLGYVVLQQVINTTESTPPLITYSNIGGMNQYELRFKMRTINGWRGIKDLYNWTGTNGDMSIKARVYWYESLLHAQAPGRYVGTDWISFDALNCLESHDPDIDGSGYQGNGGAYYISQNNKASKC